MILGIEDFASGMGLAAMRTKQIIVLVFALIGALAAQSQPQGWTVGTVMSVKKNANQVDKDHDSYDVTIRVADIDYVVVYSQPVGGGLIEYTAGRDGPVLVKEKTLTLRDKRGNPIELPIVQRRSVLKKQPS